MNNFFTSEQSLGLFSSENYLENSVIYSQTFYNELSARHNDDDNFNEYDYDYEDRGPALEIYGTDLTSLARQGQLEECFGRDRELLEMMEILVRRQKNNPVLVGDAGVGKTAIVELFATKIANNLVPFVLEGRTIVSLDLARIVAGSRYRGEFELRFQRVLDEVMAQPNIIIFIDEIHNIGGTGSAEGSLDAANILKPVLSRSGFQCIGATTTKEYQRIEKDPALNRRFQPIKVKEPSIEDTIDILYGLRPSLEGFHNVEFLPGALRLSAELASRYIYDRFLPDKAIDLVDRAAAKEVIRLTNVTEGSVISGIVNASLNNVGTLRVEAFRRGDIAAEFIFQEIENAYRNFLLRWVDNPSIVPEERKPILSPISGSLFDKMRLSILSRVDELLFASNKPRMQSRVIRQIESLSVAKNNEIFEQIKDYRDNLVAPQVSVYRTALSSFGEYSAASNLGVFARAKRRKSAKKLRLSFFDNHMYEYMCKVRRELIADPCSFTWETDFLEDDVESYHETFEILSELEEKRIVVVKDFLTDLKPLLRKGIIESLQYSSKLNLNEEELTTVYNLLGYFSTATGNNFLVNLDDPELIRRARKLGDFSGLKKRITQADIRQLLSDITGIPIQSISNVESEKLINLERTLHLRVIGQDEAISAIAKAIRRSRLGIQNPNRPIASFLFCGPTGVGKTEVTKALAVSMFGSQNDMIRFDMSEFMEKFTVSRLIGSPPGYVGYDEGGQLTDAVRRKPYSVVLFDEVEKAHPDILNVLLQILEDGRLTDSQKRLVPFENTVIIMTSNAAAEEIQQIVKNDQSKGGSIKAAVEEKNKHEVEIIEEDGKVYSVFQDEYAGPIKFLQSPITDSFLTDLRGEIQVEFEKSFRALTDYERLEKELQKDESPLPPSGTSSELQGNLKSAVLDRLSTMFLPEFLNRLDDIIIFQPLKPEELRKICDIMVADVAKRVEPKKIVLTVSNSVKLKLTREGYNPAFGARPLRRLVTKYIEDLLSETLLKNPITDQGRAIHVDLNENDQVVIVQEKE
jgi:ATP-dependent Clp protease ATP-binding subunit ClpA